MQLVIYKGGDLTGLICTKLRFNLLNPIGVEGKNSEVYKAFDPQLNATLVVKRVLKKDIIEDYKSIDESNFFNESRILYSGKHPNIMEIQYACEDDEAVYFSMPFCKNGSINSIINKRYLTVKEIIKYSLEFLSGIHYIHTKQLIHFDLKPTNIMLDNNNKAIVTDFGLAKYIDAFGFARPNKLYEPHSPPEAYKYTDFTNKSDIYQAGITLYRMCNGNDIFDLQYDICRSKGDLQKVIRNGDFPDRKFYLPHIPLKLRKVINISMNINPDDRYETILDMINDISVIEENLNWVYYKDKNINSMKWTILNGKGTHKDCIEMFDKGNNIFDIVGKKVRLSDNRETRLSPWPVVNIKFDKALKQIEKFIKKY